jgi:AraC-like DNA-binding protein
MRDQQSAVKHRPRTIQDRTDLTERARAILQERTSSPSLTIGEVAAELDVSVRTLQRAFDACGTDYSRERADARWAAALRLLGKEYTVAWVAPWCGYRSASHFIKAFSNRYGTTPGRFRLAAKIEHRLIQRRFVDTVRPVPTSSPEYFRRRKRYNEDVRALQRLVREMPLAAQEALAQVRRPQRVVYGGDKPWPRRVSTPGRSRAEFDERYSQELEALYWAQEYAALEQETRLASLED